MSNNLTAVLEFDGVTLQTVAYGQTEMQAIRFRLSPGDLMLIRVEPGNEQLPLADAAEGLLVPDEGIVSFQQEPWSAMKPDRELFMRSRIGRVFDGPGWISNLNVLENLTLSQRHHTARPIPEIIEEAERLAQSFGLPEVPPGRPAGIPRRDLRRAEWIRAFIGKPALILLERPTLGVAVEHIPRLIQAIQEARSRGAAVLWTHDEDRIWQKPLLQNSLRYMMRGHNMMAAGEE